MRLLNCSSAVVVVTIVSGAVAAQIQGGIVTRPVVYGIARSSCGDWLDAREAAKTNKHDVRYLQYAAFVDGFASAFNWYENATGSVGVFEGTNVDARYALLDERCREYPSAEFAAGVVRFLRELKASQQCVDAAKPCSAGTRDTAVPFVRG